LRRNGKVLAVYISNLKIAAKNAKDREEKVKKTLVTWCLGALVARIFHTTMKYRAKIEDVVAFIMTRQDEELAILSVEKLSGIFRLDRRLLARKFKFHKKVTLEYYLSREKIIRAAFLLVYQAGISIRQVAERMGFCSCQYFSRVFEKFCGIKPRKYRKYQQLRSVEKDRRMVEVVNRWVNIQRPPVGLPEWRKNPGDRRQVVEVRRKNNMGIMPIMPVEPIYPAYSIQGLLRMMRENEAVNG